MNTRVYIFSGKVAHLLDSPSSPNSTVPALCGTTPPWFTYWMGTGSQMEINEAASRRLCLNCKKKSIS